MNKNPKSKLSLYLKLSKSGIVTLVLISVLGGYLAGHPIDLPLDFIRLTLTLLGILCLASGASALNQIQEIEIDRQMPRTAQRPLPAGDLSMKEATGFVVLTSLIGLLILFYLDWRLGALGVASMFSYNVLYTMWWKQKMAFAAIPGAVPGALPILMGYASASGEVLSAPGLFLFLILFFWQMPHFWVLAIRFKDDYSKGQVPTLPVAIGENPTLIQISLWSFGYIGLSFLAPLFFKVGSLYLVTALISAALVLYHLRVYLRTPENKKWLKFFLWVNFSLILLIGSLVADLWSIYLIVPLTR